MTATQVEQKLKERISEICAKTVDTIDSHRPLHELGLDSMSLIDVLIFIEAEFHLRLLESRLSREDFSTIHALAAFILRESGSPDAETQNGTPGAASSI